MLEIKERKTSFTGEAPLKQFSLRVILLPRWTIIYFLISKILSFDFCCDVTRLDNTFQRFRAQVPLLHPKLEKKIWQKIFRNKNIDKKNL